MSQIGEFTRTQLGYSGRIRTLSLDVELTLVPAGVSDAENAPDYRIQLREEDGPEVGAGWKRTGERAGEYVALLLDDPPSGSRSAPTCSSRETTGPPGACTGTASRDAPSGTRPMHRLSSSARDAAVGGPHSAARLAGLLLLSGLFLVGAPLAVPTAESAPVERPASGDPYAADIAEAERRFGVPAAWIRAVKRAESAGDARAVSPAGAIGLMQIMPATWAELRGRYGLGRDPFAPRDNILAGAAYLREMLDRYRSVAAMLAAYNAGPARYDEHVAKGRALPTETRAYVAAILPTIGGKADIRAADILRANTRGWRDSPLFAGAPADASVSLPARDRPALEPQSGDLFIARSNAGGPK